jgi:hypothetical protein
MDVSHFKSTERASGTFWLGGRGGNQSELLTCWRREESSIIIKDNEMHYFSNLF